MNTADTIKHIRKHYAAYRAIERNLARKRYNGRNSASTLEALRMHESIAHGLIMTLPKPLSGALTEEHKDLMRLAASRAAGMDRPEIRRRLKDTRRQIKRARQAFPEFKEAS